MTMVGNGITVNHPLHKIAHLANSRLMHTRQLTAETFGKSLINAKRMCRLYSIGKES